MKKLVEMNLMDDFLFWTLISDTEYGPQFARYLLQVILQRTVGEVKVHAQYSFPGNDTDLHGIRLDAYISEEYTAADGIKLIDGELFDIEPNQRRGDKTELPFRVRYYHALIDARSLKAGNNYTTLRRTYVIMITDFDPFDRNHVIYTFKNQCLEEPDLPYEDGLYTLFIYTDGEQANLPENLVQLLRFMKVTVRENAVNADLESIQKMVDDMKQREEVRKAYMKFHELLQAEREAGEEAERQKAEKLVAEANERAEQANARADQAEATIVSLKRELEKYKRMNIINENH